MIKIIRWKEKYYSLLAIASQWWLRESSDLINWEIVADLSEEAIPDDFCLEHYNNYLFFNGVSDVFFYDGTSWGNCTTEMDFPTTENSSISAIKSTNNGLLIAIEGQDYYYQIVDFNRILETPVVYDSSIIYPQAVDHYTDAIKASSYIIYPQAVDHHTDEIKASSLAS